MQKFQEEDQILFEAIEAYRNGDGDKATFIYESTKKYTYKILHQEVERFKSQSILTGDEISVTEDIMQDLYIEFFNKIEKFRNEDPRSIFKWISVVSHRMLLDYVDKNKMEVLQFEKDEDYREDNDIWDSSEINDSDMESNHELLPEAALEDKEFRQLIMDFVQSLPDAQAQTILLHFRGGLKYQEIADEMGVSLITVKTRMKKAKDSLEEIITKYEKKTGTKLHSVSILPLLWLLYRMASKDTTVPVAVDATVTSSLAGASSAGVGSVATAGVTKAIGTRVLIGIVSATVVIGGVAVGSQLIDKKSETTIEQSDSKDKETQDKYLEGHHYLIWKEEVKDITEYIYESEFKKTPDGTYGGVCIASDEVLIEMGFERIVDDLGNPSYQYGDLNIMFYMGTDKFGINSKNETDAIVYGKTFWKADDKYYVDVRLALKLLVIDGYLEEATFGEFVISDGINVAEMMKKEQQNIEKTERIKMYVKHEVNVQNAMDISDEVLGVLHLNDCVMKIGEVDSWSKIVYKGYIGYVQSAALSSERVVETQDDQNESEDSVQVDDKQPELKVSQEEIEIRRTINVAYRDFLVEASGNFYGFNVIDVNKDGIPELLLDFDGPSQPIGPCDMYTYIEEYGGVKYAGTGAGALCNMVYCDETGYILAKIPGDVINGVEMYDAIVYNYSTGWLNEALRCLMGSDGQYYEWMNGNYVLLSTEKAAEIEAQFQKYFPHKVRATAPYQADKTTLNALLPIDDDGIKQQLINEQSK